MPAGSTIVAETFTGSNGAAWPAGWTTSNSTGTTVDIQSNAGRIQTTGVALISYHDWGLALYDTGSNRDIDMVGEFVWGSALEQYIDIGFRRSSTASTGDGAAPADGYTLEMQPGIANGWWLNKWTASASTTVTGGTALNMTTVTTYAFRIRVIGASIRAKVWAGTVGSGEPATWGITWVDANYPQTLATDHYLSLGALGGASQGCNVTFDNVTVTNYVEATLVQALGSATSQAATTTLSVTYTGAAKPQAGDWIVIHGVRDIVAADAPPTGDSITTTPGGETYTRVVKEAPANAVSGAATGVVGVFFYAQVGTTWAGGTNTVTWTMPSVTAKAMRVEHWVDISSVRASSAATAISAAGAPSVTSGTLTSGDVVMGMAAIENSGTQTVTADADTTNGSWSAQYTQIFTGSSSTATTARTFVKIVGQYKTVTATATQTYNVTNSNTTSVNAVAIVVGFVPSSVAVVASLTPARRGLPLALLAR